ncbi:MAG: hypothetical protein KKE24_04645 [Candidatus Thermoplasmatota archaeon]|nr:hypothetical protein [Candidatus Thermoplasmatota archaeon]
MALTITNELLLVIILVIIAVVMITGLRTIAIVQKKNENLTFVLMILVVLAVGFLTGQILLLVI